MPAAFDLHRFVVAQRDSYAQALAEIRAGQKRSHWMWFVFPQIAGLGRSDIARFYAISARDEAVAYLAHDLLGPRLVECVTALQSLASPDPVAVFGAIDATKLRSSLTLFAAAGGPAIIDAALDRWYGGGHDPMTLELLAINHAPAPAPPPHKGR